MQSIYEVVTERIISALEAGTPPWVRPWSGQLEPVPVNAGSRRAYNGINRLLLTLEGQAHGFSRNAWLTYRQAAELGGQVRGGEHGTTIVFYKRPALADTADDTSKRVAPLLRCFTVFNLAQVDGLPENVAQPAAPPTWDSLEEAERLLVGTGADIRHGGFSAFFSPAEDLIQLPDRGCFATAEDYYATATHELSHWTGAPSRCNRQLTGRFGQAAYAMEELVAEMASAFVCAHLRIDGRLQHASYVANWLDVLRADKRAIFTASAQAQRAADYLLTAEWTRDYKAQEAA
ncbi:MAG: zincin-like metallopeptidase domain-containing protein [Proteobacteria bacterium]|nr:zincin-like metallopeptidase domain-containing protein [Pseudomonadota bacterium]